MSRHKIDTMYAERLWGRGRWVRRAWRLYCVIRGHTFNHWHFDWPEDVSRGPNHDEPLFWVRGCNRDCGCVQTCCGPSLLEAPTALPGGIGPDITDYTRRTTVT